MSYVEICHCGHDKATHFESKHTCLGMRCDCAEYLDRDTPKPSAKAVRPVHHPIWCKCFACTAAPAPPLPAPDDWDPPDTHQIGCSCIHCQYGSVGRP